MPLRRVALLLFGSQVFAQDDPPNEDQAGGAVTSTTQSSRHCETPAKQVIASARNNHAQQPPVVRQQPVAPVIKRDMAPRDLPSVNAQETERAANAVRILSEAPIQGWIRNASAIAVIPGVKKAAFEFGGRWGKALMTRRDGTGNWIPPSFINIGGGNSDSKPVFRTRTLF